MRELQVIGITNQPQIKVSKGKRCKLLSEYLIEEEKWYQLLSNEQKFESTALLREIV